MKREKHRFASGLLAGLIGLFSCQHEPEVPKETLFKLLNKEQTGITFSNNLISSSEVNILEYLYFYNGGGVAAGDINNDGLVDLYFTGNQVSNKLCLNKGNFQFEDITESAGVSGDGGWSTGVTMADVNGDGLLDIYVCQVGDYGSLKGQNKLYINLGEGKFQEAAEEFGLAFKGFSTHAAFFDYDRDGDLDMYLLNHNVKSPEVFAQAANRSKSDPSGDKLFKNLLAEGGKGFEEVTSEAGIYSSILGFGLGVAVEDFNGDGWLDLYISNDFTENDYLYLNQQNGTFAESLEKLIPSTSRYSMGNDAADLNGDGWPEIFTTDMLPENPEIWMRSIGEDKAEVYQIKEKFGYGDQYVRNHLQVNQAGKSFAEIAQYAGVYASDWSWSPLIFDFDNDGRPDIHVTNGIAKRPNDLDFVQYSQSADAKTPLEEIRKKQIELLPKLEISNFAWVNQGGFKFENLTDSLGLGQIGYSNGSVYADLDNDGDLDLVTNNIDQAAFIYQNRSEKTGNRFLRIQLEGEGLNRFGLGAQVSIFSGEQFWTQRLSTSRGFQSGPSTTLVFGLGKAEKADSIRVSWADGLQETFAESEANQTLKLKRGSGRELGNSEKAEKETELTDSLSWMHLENNDLDLIKREYLALRSFSIQGPAIAVGDVNRDGLDDLYLGGAKDQAGILLLQTLSGDFEEVSNPIFRQLAKAEDTVAEFADFNGDGHLDLFVGSGGNEHPKGALFNFDRIFFGDGTGKFQFDMRAIPPIGENTSCIAIHDVDGDGDLDIFVGASVVTGDYGASPSSHLLINQGKGQFTDGTELWFGSKVDFGMVNSAVFADLDGDGQKELIFSGDWNGLRTFRKSGNSFEEFTPKGLEFAAGWIQTIRVADVNGDGKMDILTGNLGENTKLKANSKRPVWLYHHDFDRNGQADPVVFHYMRDKLVPFATRDDLIRQIPGLKRKHSDYSSYAKISLPEDLFTEEELKGVRKLPVYDFRSGAYLQQMDGSFEFLPFPEKAQWGPIFVLEWDEENQILYLGGNSTDFRVDLGKSRNLGVEKIQFKVGSWEGMGSYSTDLQNIRHIRQIKSPDQNRILVVPNDTRPFFLR